MSELDTLIAPEVLHDEFYRAIMDLARSAKIETVLEIGSSSGGGSTLAWVEGLRQNPLKPRLFCMEVSRTRCAALQERWEGEGFVHCLLASSVRPDQFGTEAEVTAFYENVDGPLRQYPLTEVLAWRQQDLDYIASREVPAGGIALIKKEHGIEHFGAVLIDGSEFTGNAELDEVYGAEFILLDDTCAFKCHQARQRLLHDPGYEMIADCPQLRHGYSIFRRRRRTRLDPLPPDAPVHFFTIVLNGEPFIRYHIDVLRQLPFRWHWHIVEGAADLVHDTAWSKATGARLTEAHHTGGLSNDGTTDYLNELQQSFAGKVSVYRPPAGKLWQGKIEMVAEPLRHIFEDGVLWQLDADELWTARQLIDGRQMFLRSPEKAVAWFWCHFFVGREWVVSSRNCYSQDPGFEWIRAWSFRPGMKWLTHEPPALAERRPDGSWQDLADGPGFKHRETEALGLVFQHFAYATPAQLAFKESYYGYAGAAAGWLTLQHQADFPLLLKNFFPWVTDDAMVDTAPSRGVVPLAIQDPVSLQWSFTDESSHPHPPLLPTIVVDGLFYQLNNTGIGTVWRQLLTLWSAMPIAPRIRVLDRGRTAPLLPGIQYHDVPLLDPDRPGEDSLMLQTICDELNAGVFISTYFSSPTCTPSIVMIHDMIPELLGLQGTNWQWDRKQLDILRASKFVCISQSTANDLRRIHPRIPAADISIIPFAAPPQFGPASAEALADFRRRHDLASDYLLLAGERIGIHVNTQGYKNAALAFKAWSLLPEKERQSLTIVCAGGLPELEEELRLLAPSAEVRLIRFSEDDLPLAFAGAVTLIYPSLYEGFGLPVLEAMACGCPVITCRRASLPEVAGEAALYVDPWDAAAAATTIQQLRNDPGLRQRLTALGFGQAARFSYRSAAELLAALLAETADLPPLPPSQATVWEAVAHLQSAKVAAETAVVAVTQREKETGKALRKATSEVAKLQKKISAMRKENAQKKRCPLKRLWDFLRRKKTY